MLTQANAGDRTVLVRTYLRCRLGVWQTVTAHKRPVLWRKRHKHFDRHCLRYGKKSPG